MTVDLDNPEEMDVLIEQDCVEAGERIRVAVRDLQDRGIIDANGNRIRTDTPPDMMPGADTDFGG